MATKSTGDLRGGLEPRRRRRPTAKSIAADGPASPASAGGLPGSLCPALLQWYDRNGRDLAWRRPERAANAYCIWVSEVMLQQTRAAVVEAYYERFLARFPDVASLAAAREDEVLALWSGLGYYRRARQLWRAAREIQRQWGGALPARYEELRRLPGIGRYTAGAILSIAFQQPWPAVDGNVRRIVSRLRGTVLPLADVERLVLGWGDRRRPGDFNQALMDLGATLCLPRQPRCPRCPLGRGCATRGELAPLRAPVPRRAVIERYLLCVRERCVLLRRRSVRSSLMPDFWELPPYRGVGRLLGSVNHAITVRSIRAEIYVAEKGAEKRPPGKRAPANRKWATREEWESLPLTGLTRKVLRRFMPA